MRFVVVHETSDGREADLVGEVLREHGLGARVIGTRHGSLIGVAQHILSIRVEVPHFEAPRAADLVEDFLRSDVPNDAAEEDEDRYLEEQELPENSGDSESGDGSENPYGAPRRDLAVEVVPAVKDPRKRIVAFAVSLLFPGGGCLYARHYTAGIVLAVAQLGAFFAMSAQLPFGLLYLLAKVADVAGGQVAVGAYNRGRPLPASVQLVFALVVIAVGRGVPLLR